MKKALRKGFTIVELAIVIAVIAILAAVLVPTITNLVMNAKLSSDTVLVKNLNTALAMEETGDKNITMSDALEDAEKNGYLISRIFPTASGNDIVWDSTSNRFALVKENEDGTIEKIYGDSATTAVSGVSVWKVTKDLNVAANGKYSYYLDTVEKGAQLTVASGIDTGKNTNISVTYENTGAAQDVVIRMKGDSCVLTVNAPNDNVDFYGFAKTITVTAVKGESLHLYGSVNKLSVESGRVEVMNSGVVFKVASVAESATVENKGYIAAAAEGVTVSGKEVGGAYTIGSLSALETFRNTVNSGNTFEGLTVELTADIALSDGWTPIGEGSREAVAGTTDYTDWKHTGTAFEGTFDGKNYTISNLNNKGFVPSADRMGVDGGESNYVYGLFALTASDATIKNLKLTKVDIDGDRYSAENVKGDSVAALVGFSAGNLTVENVTVEGSVKAVDAVGGIIGRAYGQDENGFAVTLTVTNCVNQAAVTSTNGKAAGIVGYVSKMYTVVIENCTNSGTITAQGTAFAAGILGFGGNSNKTMDIAENYTIKDNTNTGDLYCDTARVASIGYNCSHGLQADATKVISGNTFSGKAYCTKDGAAEEVADVLYVCLSINGGAANEGQA